MQAVTLKDVVDLVRCQALCDEAETGGLDLQADELRASQLVESLPCFVLVNA